MKKKKDNKKIFPSSKKIGPRNWGTEELLVHIPKVLTLKKITIKKGKKGGLQYHRKKNECGYIIKGKMLLRYDNGQKNLKKKLLKAGNTFHFPPGLVHQEEAITNCTIIEASTPHFNDRVRVEKLYGILDKSGLPTTFKKDIKFK